MFRTTFTAVALLAAAAGAQAQQPQTLKDAYKGIFYIGAAINQQQQSERDAAGAAIVKAQYNTISPENILKWEGVHPADGKYNWAPGDEYVSWGEKNNMFIIGHCLVWHSQTPRWVFQDAEGKPLTRDALLARMKDHITTVVTHYKGRIKGWDVVNEALNEDGTRRNSQWHRIIGEDFIVKAFQFAHEADPSAELYYNDYNIEQPKKRAGAIAIVKQLKEAGVPITAVGIQGHWHMDTPPLQEIDDAIAQFGALGVKVALTELDIDILPAAQQGGPSADISATAQGTAASNPYVNGLPEEMQKKLADRYADFFKIFLKHKNIVSRVTFWGVTDRESWLNGFPVRGRTNYPLLFGRDNKPKPAFDAVLKAPSLK